MSSREDLRRFRAMEIDHGAVSLYQENNTAYFCTPEGAEYVGWIGCDGVHFVLLPDDERVFCVDPVMGEEGRYVLPVGADFREFLSFLLYCRDSNPLSQLWWLGEERFIRMLEEDRAEERGELLERKESALAALTQEFQIIPQEPYARVKAMQEAFDSSALVFSDEYYDVLGLENPRHSEKERPPHTVSSTLRFEIREENMLPKDPVILLSFLNTKLRDEYPSLTELCAALNADPADLEEALRPLDYHYDPEKNQFI